MLDNNFTHFVFMYMHMFIRNDHPIMGNGNIIDVGTIYCNKIVCKYIRKNIRIHHPIMCKGNKIVVCT